MKTSLLLFFGLLCLLINPSCLPAQTMTLRANDSLQVMQLANLDTLLPEFRVFWKKFQSAVRTGNKAQLRRMIQFPLGDPILLECMGLNDSLITRKNFTKAYQALHADGFSDFILRCSVEEIIEQHQEKIMFYIQEFDRYSDYVSDVEHLSEIRVDWVRGDCCVSYFFHFRRTPQGIRLYYISSAG